MGPFLGENSLYRNLYSWLTGLLPPGWQWLAYGITGFLIIFVLVNALMVLTMVYIYMERRLLGRFQARLGPNRVGPFGLLQPVADAVKILTKEDIVPQGADRWVFNLAPVLMFTPVLLLLAVVPFGKNSFLVDLNVGVLYFMALGAVTTIVIFMAGWASANKYAMFGAMRAVAQLISYEVPVVLALAAVLLLAGSMSLVKVVEAQGIPFVLVQPLGFLVFIVGASAELNRPPFDLLEAESEIIAGYHIEYSGMKFGLFYLAEFASVLTTGAIVATVFLSGWRWWVPPSHLWFLLKVFLFAFLLIWVRATLPRLRIDQVLGFAWKGLLPLSLVNLFASAVEVLLLRDVTGALSSGDLWLMTLINWPLMVVSLLVLAQVLGQGRYRPAGRWVPASGARAEVR